jgi:hypothetical protein
MQSGPYCICVCAYMCMCVHVRACMRVCACVCGVRVWAGHGFMSADAGNYLGRFFLFFFHELDISWRTWYRAWWHEQQSLCVQVIFVFKLGGEFNFFLIICTYSGELGIWHGDTNNNFFATHRRVVLRAPRCASASVWVCVSVCVFVCVCVCMCVCLRAYACHEILPQTSDLCAYMCLTN